MPPSSIFVLIISDRGTRNRRSVQLYSRSFSASEPSAAPCRFTTKRANADLDDVAPGVMQTGQDDIPAAQLLVATGYYRRRLSVSGRSAETTSVSRKNGRRSAKFGGLAPRFE